MTSGLDIYRSANVLVKQHGQDAPVETTMNTDAMLTQARVEHALLLRLGREH